MCSIKYSKFNLLIPYENKTILFNTLYGECFLIENNEKEAIENNEFDSLSNNIKSLMVEKKIIIDDYIDENRIFELYHNKAKFGNSNLTYTLLLTWACNLRCVYCFEGGGEEKSNSMKQETADNILKYIKNEAKIKNSKSISIILFGGEPLINFKIGEYILEDLSKYCEENGIILVTSIITNAILMNQDIINKLVKYNCKYVQVTLDGDRVAHDERRIRKDGTGTFDEIIGALELLRENKDRLYTVIRVNVDKKNVANIRDLMEYLNSKNLNELGIDFGIIRGSTDACSSYEDNCYVEEEIGELLEDLKAKANDMKFDINNRVYRKWVYCGLNCDNNYSISPEGDVYNCWEHVGEEVHRIGRIDSTGKLEDIQYSYFEWLTKNPLNVSECKDCVYLPCCGGGCGSISYRKDNEYNGTGCLKIKGVIEKDVLKNIEARFN